MEAGTEVMVNREGDLCDGAEGVVLDPRTFAYEGPLVPVKLPMETDGQLHAVERFYPADALEVVGVTPDEIVSFVMDIFDASVEEAR